MTPVSTKFCRDCGQEINQKAEVCPYCGVRQQAKGYSKSTAILLALFLGGLGFHRFYLGQTVMGLMYLLFSWTFIPMFVAFIEAIVFCFMSDETFEQTYPRNKV